MVGILGDIPGVPASWVKADQPAVLISFLVGFAVYFILAKAGAWPEIVQLDGQPGQVVVKDEV